MLSEVKLISALVLVYLPFELVRKLKKEAIDERMSLSGLTQSG